MIRSGLPISVPLHVPTTWTPEEAAAVYELLDDLRELIWSLYGSQIQDQIRTQREP
jgi:hypothetical protein